MKKKILSIFITAFICLITLSGCNCSKPLNIGFEGQIIGRISDIMGAVKSNRSVFDLDDVTLDFYYGRYEYVHFNYENDEKQTIGLALYFCNETGYDAFDMDKLYEDYRRIEEQHFVKLIGAEEFDSDEYKVDINYIRTKFNHHEKLTVPSEVFVHGDDHFGLAFLYINYNKEQQKYYIGYRDCFEIKYELLNDRQVKLSPKSHNFL